MVAARRRRGETPPLYGTENDVFSVEIHHGGFFVGHGENRAYIDEKVDWFDHCEVDSWSPLWIDDFVSDLGYEKSEALKTYWLLPGKTLADGLRVIVCDSDTLVMASIVENVKNFVLYLGHDDNVAGLNWDDIVANPIATLPKVFSPKKVHIIEQKSDEHLPSFYSSIRANRGPSTINVEAQVDDEPDSEESDNDSDFVDNDYEVDQDDDDLFVDNVDLGVADKGAVNNKKAAGSRTKGQQAWKINQEGEEASTDDEDLQLPDSDDEGGSSFNFKSFREEDRSNPIFKVGQVFESAVVLRKAITEYSLKHRVNIKMPRNEKKRIQAHYEEGCSWNLYAGADSRCSGLMIKTYYGRHNCQKHWVLKRCTANWLATKYLETFRADHKMTLTSFAKTVQKEWNLTPSRSKLARARRLAMQKILGDEVEQYNRLWDYGQEGLIPAVKELFPESEHRFCVRHLYSNFQQKFKGENLKNQLWMCARSTTVDEWERNMQLMKDLNPQAYDWLLKMPPNTWVDDRGSQYIVDLNANTCDCRRWDLTGVPCSHGIAALRNERIPAESKISQCYSTEAYLKAYGHNIWPCKDQCSWEKDQIIVDHPEESLLSQLSNTMLTQLQHVSSQSSRMDFVSQPLPESGFILSNRPSARPIPPTTATKEGRARVSKRKEKGPTQKEKAAPALSKEKGPTQKKKK
ncbi:hypothetical protein QOZ80_5BG0444770 [Eleusine coracana subsp. coracana]|nr:hypothetical protein QOZ80_5BG0444770 [Eleusine coracana subsp. coracana]